MKHKTIVAGTSVAHLFIKVREAEHAARNLRNAGFTDVRLSERCGSTGDAHVPIAAGRTERDFATSLREAGFRVGDARALTTGIARGGVLLSVAAGVRIDDAIAVLHGGVVIAPHIAPIAPIPVDPIASLEKTVTVPVQRDDLVIERDRAKTETP